MKTYEYVVLSSLYGDKALEDIVAEHRAQGWEFVGGVASDGVWVMQAMERILEVPGEKEQ